MTAQRGTLVHIVNVRSATKAVLRKYVTPQPPVVGDEIRFDADELYRVVKRTHIFDEPECQFERMNVEVVKIPTRTRK